MKNPWDELTTLFTGETTADGVPEGAADNVLLSWPPILQTIQNVFGSTTGLDVLDFGCGPGDFCGKLHALGNRVCGIDYSAEMLAVARRRVAPDVRLLTPEQFADSTDPFDVITAAMVFQFIDDIEGVLAQLVARLKPSGTLVFAVFNPAFVVNLIAQGRLFHGFDSATHPTRGLMVPTKGIEIPVHVRSAGQYAEMLTRLGYKEISRVLPPFNPVFLKRYPMRFSVRDGEFLIQGFVRQA
jgi:2-polyprenyl-3-methyl-5-hydroxy-6-metoxy-1,4-benzoquinol methylase